MVTAFLHPEHGQGTALGKITLGLGAAFILATGFLLLERAVTRRVAPDGDMSVSVLQNLPAGERAEARRAAGAAFARDPLDADALLALSHIAEADGDSEAAQRLKLIAGDMKPRVAAVQAEALAILLQRRDFGNVMKRLNGLIRARPPEAAGFFAVAAEIAKDADGRRAVARLLATSPPWRASFFSYLVAKGQRDSAIAVIAAMRDAAAPVADAELRGIIDDLLRRNELDKAYGVWLASLTDTELKSVKRLYDGDFNQPVRSLRFDWTITPGDGFTYRIFPRNTASMDQTMQIDFTGLAGGFSNLSQMLRLKPGRYSLSGEVRFDNFVSPSALVFRIYCFDAGKARLLEETPALPQSTQWIAFDKTFTVPEGACLNQRLQLESKTKLQVAEETRGMVALDSISIDKLPELVP